MIAPLLRFRRGPMPECWVKPGRHCCATGSSAPPRAYPDKAFIVSADDGRTLTYGQLRALTGRIATHLRDAGLGANDRIALLVQQFDRASGHLLRRAGLWRDHLHRPCRDEQEPARQHPAHAASRAWCCARRASGLTTSLRPHRAPCLPLGASDDRRGDSFFAAVQPLRSRATPRPGRRRRQRGHSVHLGDQRAAEGRGAELPRAVCPTPSRPPTASA